MDGWNGGREEWRRGEMEVWRNVSHQITGAERSLVTVGRSLTVAKGFPPLWE